MAETFKSTRNGKFKVNCIAVIQSSLFKNLFFLVQILDCIFKNIQIELLYSSLLFLIRVNILCYMDQTQP